MIIVTLIHGTFAQNANWTKKDSPFCHRLVQKLDGDVKIESFKWSGKNSFSARKKASQDLEEHVRSIFIQHPNNFHFIIAHSHGGNISLQARLGRRIRGLVFLSTPFILAQPRHYSEFRFHWLKAAFSCLVTFSVLNFYTYLSHQTVSDIETLIFLLISYTVMQIPLTWYLERVVDNAQKIYKDLRRSVPYPTLIIRSSGDEASGILSFSSTISWLINKLLYYFEITAIFGGLILLGTASIENLDTALTLCSLMTFGFLMVIITVGLLALPYGKWFGLENFFVEVTAEATPEGTATVSHVLARTFFIREKNEGSLDRGLAHSCTYTNLNVVDEIARWIKAEINSSPDSGRT